MRSKLQRQFRVGDRVRYRYKHRDSNPVLDTILKIEEADPIMAIASII